MNGKGIQDAGRASMSFGACERKGQLGQGYFRGMKYSPWLLPSDQWVLALISPA